MWSYREYKASLSKPENGTVASGYFTYPNGWTTWIDPNWRENPVFGEHQFMIEREIDRRTRIVAMGA